MRGCGQTQGSRLRRGWSVPPQDVADAVLAAIVGGRAEFDVSVPKLRAMATIALVRPAWIAAINRRGSKEFAAAMTEAHSPKWR
jgi:hypothetical protein